MNSTKPISSKSILLNFTLLVTGIFFFVYGIMEAKEFLAVFVLAMVLALLTFPLATKLESKGLKPIFATIINVMLLLLFAFLISWILSRQMKNIMDDWDEIQESFVPKIEQLESMIIKNTPMQKEDFSNSKPNLRGSETGKDKDAVQEGSNGNMAIKVVGGVSSFLTEFLITFIYVFFFIHYRSRFKRFLLKLFHPSKQEEVKVIISESASVVRNYVIGRLILMVFLIVLYGLGLWISGVQNFIVISMISGLLSLVPFVGNFLGYMLAMVMGVFSGGDMSILIGVTVTFLAVQFVETYIMQPIVLGSKLNVHPFFIIVSVILGSSIWGVIGMVLAIPIFAIICVISRHVPALEPFGYLFSSDGEEITHKPK
jgi:predicted PurR-regulated permease PerM